MRDLPTWITGLVRGALWGAGCGAGLAAILILARVALGGAEGDNAYQFLVGVPLVGALACVIGAIAGAVVGCATGLTAGLVLTGALRVSSPRIASVTTGAVVLVLQAAAEFGLCGPPSADNWWTYAVVPAITLLAMGCTIPAEARIARSMAA